MIIYLGGIPYLWDVAGDITGWLGYGLEYEVIGVIVYELSVSLHLVCFGGGILIPHL